MATNGRRGREGYDQYHKYRHDGYGARHSYEDERDRKHSSRYYDNYDNYNDGNRTRERYEEEYDRPYLHDSGPSYHARDQSRRHGELSAPYRNDSYGAHQPNREALGHRGYKRKNSPYNTQPQHKVKSEDEEQKQIQEEPKPTVTKPTLLQSAFGIESTNVKVELEKAPNYDMKGRLGYITTREKMDYAALKVISEDKDRKTLKVKILEYESCTKEEDPFLIMQVASNSKGPDMVIYPETTEEEDNLAKTANQFINNKYYVECGGNGIHSLFLVPVRNLRKYKLGGNPGFYGYVLPKQVPKMCKELVQKETLNLILDLDHTLLRSYSTNTYQNLDVSAEQRGLMEKDVENLNLFATEDKILNHANGNLIFHDNQKKFWTVEAGSNQLQQKEKFVIMMHSNMTWSRIKPGMEDKIFSRYEKGERGTSRLMYIRGGWQHLRDEVLRKRFQVYVCTCAEGDYVYDVWDSLDPDGKILKKEDISNRIICVKGNTKKNLSHLFTPSIVEGYYPTPLSVIVDDQPRAWNKASWSQIVPVEPFCIYQPKGEMIEKKAYLEHIGYVLEQIRSTFYKHFNEYARSDARRFFHLDDSSDCEEFPLSKRTLLNHIDEARKKFNLDLEEEEVREEDMSSAATKEEEEREKKGKQILGQLMEKFMEELEQFKPLEYRIEFLTGCIEYAQNIPKNRPMNGAEINYQMPMNDGPRQGVLQNHNVSGEGPSSFNMVGGQAYQQYPQVHDGHGGHANPASMSIAREGGQAYQQYPQVHDGHGGHANPAQTSIVRGGQAYQQYAQAPSTSMVVGALYNDGGNPGVRKILPLESDNAYKAFLILRFPPHFVPTLHTAASKIYEYMTIQLTDRESKILHGTVFQDASSCPNNLAALNQMCQQIQNKNLKHSMQLGSESAFKFASIVQIKGINIGIGVASDKKTAEHAAAMATLIELNYDHFPL